MDDVVLKVGDAWSGHDPISGGFRIPIIVVDIYREPIAEFVAILLQEHPRRRVTSIPRVFRHGIFQKLDERLIPSIVAGKLIGVGDTNMDRDIEPDGIVEVRRGGQQAMCLATNPGPCVWVSIT
jgi:hypothetical protein